MIVYYVMLVLSVGFCWMTERNDKAVSIAVKKIYLSISFFSLVLVSAIRENVGIDYQAYIGIFNNISYYDNRTHVETGFYYLVKFIGLLTKNPQWMFAAMSFLTIAVFYIAVYFYSPKKTMSIFLFITMGFYFYAMNTIRYYFALGCALLAGLLWKNKKYSLSLMCILFGFLFHKSILLVIPLFLICNLKLTAKYYFILLEIFIAFVICKPLIRKLIFLFYPSYQNSKYDNGHVSIYNIGLGIIIIVLMVIYIKDLLQGNNYFFLNLCYISLFSYIFAGWWIPEFSRIGFYFNIFYIIIIPTIFECEKNAKMKRFLYISTCLVYLVFMGTMLLKMDTTVGVYPFLPYQTCF